MSTESGWAERVLAGGVGGVIGALVTQGWNWYLRSQRVRANWNALAAEIDAAKHKAQGFLGSTVKQPLYRLPDSSFRLCYPQLIADGALSAEEAVVLSTFYAEVETLNRGLERAAEAEGTAVDQEHNRNRLKAQRIAEDGSAFKAAQMLCQTRT